MGTSYSQTKQLVAVNRPDGVTVEYLYEGDNDSRLPLPNPNTGRLKKIVQPRGDTVFSYYGDVPGEPKSGKLKSIISPDNEGLIYEYDGSLLLSTTWSSADFAARVSWIYDNNFWISSESINGGDVVDFSYDLDGLLTSVSHAIDGYQVSLEIHRNIDNGLIAGSTILAISDKFSYNGFAEPIGYTATYNGTNTLYDVSYVRDAIGRITSKTETVNGVTTTYGYHYDLAGRLTGVDKDGIASSTYTYDSNGNRLSYSGELGSFTGAYDAQDRLLSYGDFVYEYTENGELKSKTNMISGEEWQFSYDAMGGLLKAVLPDGTQIDYVLDGTGRRLGKKVDGAFTEGYLYADEFEVVAIIDGGGNVTARISGDTLRKGGKIYRMIRDNVGSVIAVVDVDNGDIVQQITYDEFGNMLADTNPAFQPFGFGGGLLDAHTGLTRFGHRDYEASSGRWLSKDPLRFMAGENFYAFSENDPINRRDTVGLSSENSVPIRGGCRITSSWWNTGIICGPIPTGSLKSCLNSLFGAPRKYCAVQTCFQGRSIVCKCADDNPGDIKGNGPAICCKG